MTKAGGNASCIFVLVAVLIVTSCGSDASDAGTTAGESTSTVTTASSTAPTSSTTTTVPATTTAPSSSTTIPQALSGAGDPSSVALDFVRLVTSGRGLEPVAADYRFTVPGGGTEPAPETAAKLFADSAAMRGLPTITSIEVAPTAHAGFSAGCYFAGDIHQACDINIARGSSPTLAISVFMIPDRKDPQHRFVVDSFFFPPIQNAIVFVERAIRGASVEDLVATQIYAEPLNTKTAVPNRPSELNAKAKTLATTGPARVSARPASRTEGPHDCRAVLGRATTLECTIDITKDGSVTTVVVTMDGINAPHYKVSDFTTK